MNLQFGITSRLSLTSIFYLKLKLMYIRKKNGSPQEISIRKIFKKGLKNLKIIPKCFD